MGRPPKTTVDAKPGSHIWPERVSVMASDGSGRAGNVCMRRWDSSMTPTLLFDPVSDVAEAPTRMSDRKVVDPAAQNDLFDQFNDRPGTKPSKNRFDSCETRSSAFCLSAYAAASLDAGDCGFRRNSNPRNPKLPPSLKVHLSSLFFVSPPPVVWPTPPGTRRRMVQQLQPVRAQLTPQSDETNEAVVRRGPYILGTRPTVFGGKDPRPQRPQQLLNITSAVK
jgi:hypothetical protein